jgi:hypothetical protein
VRLEEPESLPPLLLRQATGDAASSVVEALVGCARPELVALARTPGTVVMWLGDVAIHDAVPLCAAIVVVDGDVAALAAAAAATGWRNVLGARLSREVVAVCRTMGCRRLLTPGPERADAQTTAFGSLLTAGLTIDRTVGGWSIEV